LFPSLASSCRGVVYVAGFSSAAAGTDVTATAEADDVTSLSSTFGGFAFILYQSSQIPATQ
jgi:hypothetical protein